MTQPQPQPAATPTPVPTSTPTARRRRSAGRAAVRILALWAASTTALVLLAWVLPDLHVRPHHNAGLIATLTAAAVASGLFGLLSGLVWPLLVRALLLVPAVLLGLLVFTLNGVLVLIAFDLIPDQQVRVGWETAVVVAAGLSLALSTTAAALGTWDTEAYHRRLVRLAVPRRNRHYLAGPHPGAPGRAERPPGVLFLQLDGVGHDILHYAVEQGFAPNLGAWMGKPGPARAGTGTEPEPEPEPEPAPPTHELLRWRTDWSSQTGASQLGILHGSNFDVPAFRWYEKENRRLMVCNHPATAGALERRMLDEEGRPGLLAAVPDGASRGNLFSGGAASNALVLSTSMRRRRGRRRSGYFAYFSDPANAVRTAGRFWMEVVRELGQALRQRLRREQPRVRRGPLYAFVRAFATVVERDVVVTSVLGDVMAGRDAVYADLVGYDEVAHHSGIDRTETLQVLRRIDKAVGLIASVARDYAPRCYHLVVLSDHGQSEGPYFEQEFGETLEDVVRAGMVTPAVPVPSPAGELLVLGSGNLGLIYFTDTEHRLSHEEIQHRYPHLLDTLTHHPGIGFLLIRSTARGPLALGADGTRELATGRVTGTDPLAHYGAGAPETVLRTDGFPHVADIMVGGSYDPDSGTVHAFEEQIGSHGGLGGPQNSPFLLRPLDLPMPTSGPAAGDELLGAEQVHHLLRGWLELLQTRHTSPQPPPDRTI